MTYTNILVEKENRITYITINRPKQLNALNRGTISELYDVISIAQKDQETRVMILTGSGEKSFVAGADIKEFIDYNVSEGTELAAHGQEHLFDFIENSSKPVIAAINGFALGGGLELAMAAHIRVASDNVRLGLPETSLGIIPGYGGTQRLPQLVGKGRAFEIITTAEMITAEKACETGLVNHVVPQVELKGFCEILAQKIIKNSPTAISSVIRSVNAGFKKDVNGFKVEIKEFGKCFSTRDFKEGTSAFLEKRKANF